MPSSAAELNRTTRSATARNLTSAVSEPSKKVNYLVCTLSGDNTCLRGAANNVLGLCLQAVRPVPSSSKSVSPASNLGGKRKSSASHCAVAPNQREEVNYSSICMQKYFFSYLNDVRTSLNFFPPQRVRGCPFCGRAYNQLHTLRSHLEAKHQSQILQFGPEGVNAKIFHRAKSGIRRISPKQISGLLKTVPRKQRKNYISFLKAVLSLCLVEIGEDTL